MSPGRAGASGHRWWWPALVAAVVIGGSATSACTVDEASFEQRIFACDPSASEPGCGTDKEGQAMVCFPASQLDGVDFCTAQCADQPMTLAAESAVCVQGGAKLKACDPTAEAPCGQADLACLRTDVSTDGAAAEGVCVTGHTCSADTDCPDPVRSTCAATFLKELYSANDRLAADHLYCLQRGCRAGNGACSAGQSCLPNLIPADANPPDICVPNCDSFSRCPPNHFCFRKLTNASNPAICIPGLLGFVCETDVDCLVGRCMSDEEPNEGLRLDLCSVSCVGDEDCARYDSPQGQFVCLQGRCATPDAYRGSTCFRDSDCTRDEGTVCAFSEVPTDDAAMGTCILPCDATLACPRRAGFGQTCVPTYDPRGQLRPACLPGRFFYPCATNDNCAVTTDHNGLSCRGADAATGQPGRCTLLCQTDQDCADNRWTPDASCTGGICVPNVNLAVGD